MHSPVLINAQTLVILCEAAAVCELPSHIPGSGAVGGMPLWPGEGGPLSPPDWCQCQHCYICKFPQLTCHAYIYSFTWPHETWLHQIFNVDRPVYSWIVWVLWCVYLTLLLHGLLCPSLTVRYGLYVVDIAQQSVLYGLYSTKPEGLCNWNHTTWDYIAICTIHPVGR